MAAVRTMNAFAELANMQEIFSRLGTGAAVTHYAGLCGKDNEYFERIKAVRLVDDALDRIFGAYCKALKAARKNDAAAIYFEYDLDNDWNANFFVCPTYNPQSFGNDDWACNYTSSIRASGIYEFGRIYKQLGGFCKNDTSTAATMYMIARTSNALMDVVERKPHDSLAICIGFHDQDPIHRLRNGLKDCTNSETAPNP